MTPVELKLVSPKGDPIANTSVLIQLSRSGFSDDTVGVILPRPVTVQTDDQGEALVSLLPSDSLYFIEVSDSESEAGIFYKFIVPEVPEGTSVRLQDIVIDGPMSGTNYDEAALAAIASSKVNSRASELAAAASAAQAATIVANVSADVAEALEAAEQLVESGVAAQGFATAAEGSATTASAKLASMQLLATTVEDHADTATTAAAVAVAARNDATTAATGLASAVSAAESAAASAEASQDIATSAATSASANAGVATTQRGLAQTAATDAAAAAAAAQQAAADAENAAGNPVSSFNTRTGAVILSSADVIAALSFTPYSNDNPAGFLNLAGLLAADGAGSDLDADLLDGQHGAHYLALGNATGTLAAARLAGSYNISITGVAATATKLATARKINGVDFDGTGDIVVEAGAGVFLPLGGGTLTGALTGTSAAFASLAVGGNAAWHAGNFDPASKLGVGATAVAALILQNSRTITIGGTGRSFNGSANLNWSLSDMGAQAALVSGTNLKTVNGVSLLGAGNVDTGGSITGLLKSNGSGVFAAANAGFDYVAPNGSITGNAGTATKLTTPRTINGIPFDGTQNILVPAVGAWWGEPQTLTVADNGHVLELGKTYHLDSRGGMFNVQLPVVMASNTWIKLVDVAGALEEFPVTVQRNGHAIRDVNEDLVLDKAWDSLELVGTATGVIEQ